MGDVIRLDLPVNDEAVLEPDFILDSAKGQYQQLLVAGYDQDGKISIRATHGSREVLWMLNRAIVHLMLETE